LAGLGALAALAGSFYAEEDWRGHRDWNQYRQAKEANGEHLEFGAYLPKPVPDEENFAATDLAASLDVFRLNPSYPRDRSAACT